jgi:hypothetical protein
MPRGEWRHESTSLFFCFPIGQPVIVQQLLFQVSGLPAKTCIDTGLGLFHGQFSKENPVIIPVTNPDRLKEFERVCAEFGILVERFD